MTSALDKPERLREARIEYHDKGPDERGRRHYTLFWWTDYTPSKPYPHERGQVFFAVPPALALRKEVSDDKRTG